jgi:glutamate--cysteine ligase regulatory subunit
LRASSNIVSGGPSIIRKPGAYRSNLELINSLRSNFLAAQQDYAAAAVTNGNGHGNGNGNGNGNGDSVAVRYDDDVDRPAHRTPASLWTAQEGSVLYVPRIDWDLSGLQEEMSQYEITAKLFFLNNASPVARRPQFVAEALDLVLRELHVSRVNLLIISFPGMSFDGDCEWEADKRNGLQGSDDDEAATWAIAEDFYRKGVVRSLGIAEFGSKPLGGDLKLLCRIAKGEERQNPDLCSAVSIMMMWNLI